MSPAGETHEASVRRDLRESGRLLLRLARALRASAIRRPGIRGYVGDLFSAIAASPVLVSPSSGHPDGPRRFYSINDFVRCGFHSIYELEVDPQHGWAAVPGSLRRLTAERDATDIEPVYLPDGKLVFSSTREPKYCHCNMHIMATLSRMDGDGANIHQIGKSRLFEGHASLIPDGRVLYYRWENVDRDFGDAQGL